MDFIGRSKCNDSGVNCDSSPLTWNLLMASVLKEAQMRTKILLVNERIAYSAKVVNISGYIINLPASRQTKVDSLAVVWITPPPSEPCKEVLDHLSSK